MLFKQATRSVPRNRWNISGNSPLFLFRKTCKLHATNVSWYLHATSKIRTLHLSSIDKWRLQLKEHTMKALQSGSIRFLAQIDCLSNVSMAASNNQSLTNHLCRIRNECWTNIVAKHLKASKCSWRANKRKILLWEYFKPPK